MAFVGLIPENHDWCLQELLKVIPEIIKHFPDILPETVPQLSLHDIILPICEEMARYGFVCLPASADLEGYFFEIVKNFANRKVYGTAFCVAVLGMLQPSSKEICFETTLALRKKLFENLGEYEAQLKIFEPVLKKIFTTLNKSAFFYLDMMLDDKYFFHLGNRDIKFEERTDIRLNYLRKRYQAQWWPNGKTPYLYKILEAALMYLNMQRLKQARHLIAVVSELMKTVNQDTAMFRKLREMFFMVKTMYWATLLACSEMKEVLLKSPLLAPSATEVALKDKVIDFGISLPDGEDPDLPTDYLETEAQRVPIYERLKTHKETLETSSLPRVHEIYDSVLFCDINFYDANNGNPFCCGKHNCRHPH